MENTKTARVPKPEIKETKSITDIHEGKSLEQIYHDESEQAYLDKFTAGVDFLMMQFQEGLL